MALLELSGVCAAPWGAAEVLRDIDFRLERGEVLALLGPNGAGKSTLLHLLCGAIAASRGEYRFGGLPFAGIGMAQRARSQAILPQHSALNFPFTVAEVVLLGRTPHASGARADRDIVATCLEATDTLALRDRLYTQLSGGERQRVQLARVMAQIWRGEDAPERLLLLDEPTAALDLAHQKLAMQGVRGLAETGCGVVMILHDFNLAARYADRCLVLAQGSQSVWGAPREVLTPDLFQCVFGVAAEVMPHPADGSPVVLPA
jgi:iron complex transport system ATP-binding protein